MTVHRIVLACAVVAALVVPAAVLSRHWRMLASGRPQVVEVRGAPMPPIVHDALSRPLFSYSVKPADATDQLPRLIGIVGRLPDDGVAMVRDEGRTRSLRIGEVVASWRLTALSSEAAIFERGSERRSVALPAGQ